MKCKMKILTVIAQYYPCRGGAENVAREVVEYTNGNDITNDVLTIATERILALMEDSYCCEREIMTCPEGDKYTVFRMRPFTLFGQQKDGRYFRYYTLLKLIWHLCWLAPRYDIIHVHTFYWEAVASILVGRIFKIPVIITGHSSLKCLVEDVEAGNLPRFMLNILKYSDLYISINRNISNEAIEIAGIDKSRIKLVHNGIDTTNFSPVSPEMKVRLRSKLGLPLDKKIIIYHGRLIGSNGDGTKKTLNIGDKNLITLLEAIVNSAHRDNILVILLGEGGGRKSLENAVLQMELDKQVFFLGHSTLVADYLKASDIFCLPSFIEGLSLSLLEAMATGLVCVVSDISGNRECITDRVNGYLFDPSSTEQLISLLDEVIESQDTKTGNMARETAVNLFGRETMINYYKGIYKQYSKNIL